MVVWIVNPFDNLPLEGYRPQRYWLMARAFARAGHTVTLWTSDFSHALKAPHTFNDPNVLNDRKGFITADGFRLRLMPTRPYPTNICLRRIASHRALARTWRKMAEAEATSPDVVIASTPPLSLCSAARRYCTAHHIPLVVEVMDAWPENFERVVPRWFLAPLRRAARANYRAAAAITVVADRYAELVKTYGAIAPIRLFHHGIEQPPSVPRPPSRDPATLTLAYAGNMGKSYDLATAIDTVKGMEGVRLELAGTGPDEGRLRERAAGCDRILFRGQLDDAGLRAMLAAGDAALIPMFDDACVGVPYKLADYAAAGLPILNTLRGETERLLEQFGVGITYAAGDAGALRAALERLKAADRAKLSDGARQLAERFDAARIYPAFVRFVEETSARSLV